jgi:hypothetical protein
MAEPPDDSHGESPRAPATRPAQAAWVADLTLIGVCAWFLWRDFATAQAGQVIFQARPWTFMLNLTATFVVAHRGVALIQRGVNDPQARRVLGVIKWLAAFGLPLLVATGLERQVQQVHRANVDLLAADLAARTQRAIHERGQVEPADLSPVKSPYLAALSVRADTGEFLLQVRIPGLDIDGYTGFRASTEDRWHIHSADAPQRPPAFDTSGPILACNPSDAGLTCQ